MKLFMYSQKLQPIKVNNFIFFCSYMYLLMRIISLSWLMTYLVKQIPTYFLMKLFSRKSLVAKNLPTELQMQIPYSSHKSTWSRSPREQQSLRYTAEKTWIRKQKRAKWKTEEFCQKFQPELKNKSVAGKGRGSWDRDWTCRKNGSCF